MSAKGPKDFSLKVTPAGGVGEIGSNCALFENENNIVFVDYGILFPYEDFFDINYLIADLEGYRDTSKKVSLFITHGHEDHIGAVVHFNEMFPQAEIFAPKFAERLIRRKLHLSGQSARITVYDESAVLDFDNFEIHPITVTHSIPDTYGLMAKEKQGLFGLLYISDFKYDLDPIYEKPFNTRKIQKLFSESAKTYCMMDSTNILNPDKTLSERDLIEDLEELVSMPGRLFVTLFSSNIYRLKSVFLLAQKHGKRVVPIGRSVRHYIESAQECGFFGDEIAVLKEEREVQEPEKEKNIYILTGCQGDHFGALRRVASGEHKFLKPGPGDTFVFSSKAIPGNEGKITRIYNMLSEKGAEIVTNKDKKIHASGHPGQEDLLQLYRAISPDAVVPIHGESFFLKKHLEFLETTKTAKGIALKNFDSLLIGLDGEAKVCAAESAPPPLLIHGKGKLIEREAISKRRKMACNGVVFLSVDVKTKHISLSVNGLPESIQKDMPKVYNLVKGQLGKKLLSRDGDHIAEELRIFTRNLFNNYLGYKPVTMVHIL